MIRVTRQDAVGKAVGWLSAGLAAGLGLDLCAKQLLTSYSLVQFVFLRSLAGLALFLLLARALGGLGRLQTLRWRWHLLRTMLATGAMFGFFYGLAHMPLVNALTLGFTAPLMLAALSHPLLGEPVGWRRWAAVVAGFCGVLIVLRPSAEAASVASLAVLASALCYACLAITARHLGQTESSYALAVYVVAGPLALSALMLLRGAPWLVPARGDWLLFGMAGAFSVLAWLGIINGYRYASPVILAPLEYMTLVAGTGAGWALWGEIPDAGVLAGATIIMASGLYVVYRELGGRRKLPAAAPRRRWLRRRPP
jgi:drug/metabolite transporter (DMT)-like permease